MKSDRLTLKAQEALQESQRLAEELGHPEIRPLHLLSVLTRQEDGIVAPILSASAPTPAPSPRLPRAS